MPREKKRRTGRRSPLAAAGLIGIGLLLTGGLYAGASAAMASTPEVATQTLTVDDGEKLFQANWAVDFQVATGRMPLQMQGPQAPQKPVQFTDEQIAAMAAYVQSVAPGPEIASGEVLDGEGDVAHGAELFRINCAMCHNVAAAGGALTEGKYAPSLVGVDPRHIYAAMVTGPQNMPVFNDLNLSPEDKRDIISSLLWMERNSGAGGFTLGSLGPVSEGLFIWIFGIGALVAFTVWITAKSN
jgi:ubiquinol-cytochrome c reductase cytochrome c subunit